MASSVLTIVRIACGSGDGLLHLLKAQAAVDLGAVEEQLFRLVLRGHQHQSPLTVDAGLKPGAGSQSRRRSVGGHLMLACFDIVLVAFPFTDGPNVKLRLAMVIWLSERHQDDLLAFN